MVPDTAKGETIGDPNGGHVFQPRKCHFGHLEEPGVIYLTGNIKFWLGGGFNFFNVHPYLGKILILTNIFQRGWNHQLVELLFHGPKWLSEGYI